MTYLLLFPALLPIITALIMMCKFKVSPGKSMLSALILTVVFAAFIWKMNLLEITAAGTLGVFKSLDIIFIIAGAVLLLNILQQSGAINTINRIFSGISSDRRIQIIVIAWLFSGFVEGASGFGAAPALAAPLLAGLGFPPLIAVATALICNTLPVPFGAVGIPVMTSITTLSERIANSGVSQPEFIHTVFDKLTLISGLSGLFLPLTAIAFMIIATGGKRKMRSILEITPLALLSAAFYIIPWRISALWFGAELPSMIGCIIGLPLTMLCIYFKFLVPRYIWDFPENKIVIPEKIKTETPGMPAIQALAPYLIMALSLMIMRFPGLGIQELIGRIKITLPDFPAANCSGSSWKILNNPGIFPISIIALASAWCWKFSLPQTLTAVRKTFSQIAISALAIAASTAMVQIMINSSVNGASIPGMLDCVTHTCAAITGKYFIVISPFIGIFGTFFAGSCTVSNILFAPLQFDTAAMLEINPALTVALQNIGGGLGSMIRISGIIAACATVNLNGKEGKVILMNLLPVIFMALLTVLFAYIAG
ncbi:MAG: L-lactate permease [Lentisphaeria bacterium]|nr:L-lactate permease [Lentisphaeria bacterium]